MSGKRAARHAQSKGRNRALIGAAVVAAVVAGVLAVTLGWLPGSGSGESDNESASGPTASADASASGRAESPSSTPSPDRPAAKKAGLSKSLRACASSIREEQRAVDAAGRGVRNWNDHVQARTAMLDGRISMEKMDAIWARTQAAGPGDQKRFTQAMQATAPSKCARLRDARDSKLAARCVKRSQAASRALDSAKAAMKDWDVHLTNMRKYAKNKMSASMAQGKWVKAWRNAPKNISAYREARATLAKAPTCTAAAS